MNEQTLFAAYREAATQQLSDTWDTAQRLVEQLEQRPVLQRVAVWLRDQVLEPEVVPDPD